jgi:serine/threonine protein kinase
MDIKPQNILFMKDKTVKLADFGLSSQMSSSSGFNQVYKGGTPLYEAPELILSKPYDPKVDMWALGCVLYYMAC